MVVAAMVLRAARREGEVAKPLVKSSNELRPRLLLLSSTEGTPSHQLNTREHALSGDVHTKPAGDTLTQCALNRKSPSR
jgi:hypothetical protein